MMADPMEGLRFAAIARVSTEKQQKRGESLRTQRTQVGDAVTASRGRIVEWYGGQEHATDGWEKTEVDRLLRDAEKKHRAFDAVIVQHPDRWSRDNVASATGLNRLKDAGVRFFVLSQEFDLTSPTDRFFLGMSALIGGYASQTQRQKSVINRIHRARRGVPTAGKLPFGRIFDRDTEKWSVDPKATAMMQDVARRYLAGESMVDLAAEYGVNHANLHKTLMHRCGTDWSIDFSAPEFRIQESIPVTIPCLLSDDVIAKVRERAQANRTYAQKAAKYEYLLGHFVYCAACGYKSFGQASGKGLRLYYRHAHTPRVHRCPSPHGQVPITGLEAAVLSELFDCFGNPHAVARAVAAATPDQERIDALRATRDRLEGQLADVVAARKRVLATIARGRVTEDEADESLSELRTREDSLQRTLNQTVAELVGIPDADHVSRAAEAVADSFRETWRLTQRRLAKQKANRSLTAMSWKEKRALVEAVFGERIPRANLTASTSIRKRKASAGPDVIASRSSVV